MATKRRFVAVGLVGLGIALAVACAQEQQKQPPTLKVGDPAPSLAVAEWVKGEPVDIEAGKGKTVYVVEFWATWCPPCRRSIPHLTEVQKQVKDRGVEIIGVSTEDPKIVKDFVAKMGEEMDYHVAIDDNRKTFNAYMVAAGQDGIPHAFLIDKDGKIAWHGHPLDPAFTSSIDKLAPKKTESEKEAGSNK